MELVLVFREFSFGGLHFDADVPARDDEDNVMAFFAPEAVKMPSLVFERAGVLSVVEDLPPAEIVEDG